MPDTAPSPVRDRQPVSLDRQIRVLLTVTFITVVAQMSLSPVIAPLARTVGLADWQVGVTVSAAALMVALTSPAWGRRSQSAGRRSVLTAALAAAAVTTALFAGVAVLGTAGIVGGTGLFVLFLLLRGVLFGASVAAVPPTAQAAVADATTSADGSVDSDARVTGMARLGAVQGVGQIAGSALGGLLAVFGLVVPLVTVPVLLVLSVLLVRTRLHSQPPAELVRRPRPVRPTDRRVLPFLVCGFGMYLALGFIQIIVGFLVQDRIGVSEDRAGLLTGLALLTAGAGVVTAQVLVVPRSGWSPGKLLRVGATTAAAGFVVLIPETSSVPLTTALLYVGVAVVAVGMGTATPGFTAGASLQVTQAEQGGVAGLVTATMGLTMVVAPTLGTVLYGVGTSVPVAAGAAVTAAVAVCTVISPRLRNSAKTGGPSIREA
ncbi:MFS transporter [Corynebacterium provencense]|uniref:MFS transporter n=1 Tax=Corynebacterium provencense TaxID=1737425 RepID=UPI000836C7FD|nr:MFS transporter [Corynebacterium provencense]